MPLGALVERLNSGVSVNGEDRAAQSDELGVLKISAVTSGTFDPTEHKVVNSAELERVRVSPLRGRIIVSRSNTADLVGASAYVHDDHPRLFLSDKLWQVEPRNPGKVHMPWLAQWLGSAHVRSLLSKLATGTSGSMKNISKDAFLGLTVDVPPTHEQVAIAKALSVWDAAIATTERLLANSQTQKRALMHTLLSPSQGGEGWKSYRLGSLFRERAETRRDDLPLLSITREEGVIPRADVGRKDTSNEDKSKYLRICPGDIGYNTMRMWQGVSALSSLEGIVSPAYTIVTPSEKVDGRYAAHLFKLPSMVFTFYRHSQGLVSDTWSLKFDHFKKIHVSIPGHKEQARIVRILSAADEVIASLSAQIERLRIEKSALMQQLLTGKRRVRLPAPVKAAST
jgi:type I restriction enzyme S subunit